MGLEQSGALTILCFGPARAVTGTSALRYVHRIPCSVAELRQSILRDYPAFGSIELLRIAVDQSYADDVQTIQGDEEIALILPVSGG